jgi:hypothetical protein
MPSPQHADQTVSHAIAQPRLAIEAVQPIIEGGRFASKCLCGREFPVTAVTFSDGHEQLAADLLWRASGEATWQRTPMQALGNDRWSAVLRIDHQGRGEFAIEAWLEGHDAAVAEYEIAGRRMKYIPTAELIKLRQRYLLEVANEKARANLAAGLGGGRKIQFRLSPFPNASALPGAP